jgi:hypothetical protein
LTESPSNAEPAKAMAANAGTTEQSFPLIALLQLATFMAAITACVDSKALLKRVDQAAQNPLEAAAVGAIGFLIGLGQLRMARSALVGGAVGAAFGLAILAIYLAPAPPIRTAGAVAVLLVSTIAIRVRAA